MWRVIFVFVLCVMGAGALGAAADAVERGEESVWGRPGIVVMLRHAYAPGVGDPQNFVLGDCATQRNLDETGRVQARALGERWRRELGEARVGDVRVYTSEWCRCRETATLLGLGKVEVLPALNSFFQRPEERAGRMAALREFLAAQPVDGALVVLVTHQVNITALTGVVPRSGEGVVLRLNGTGEPEVVGRIGNDQ